MTLGPLSSLFQSRLVESIESFDKGHMRPREERYCGAPDSQGYQQWDLQDLLQWFNITGASENIISTVAWSG